MKSDGLQSVVSRNKEILSASQAFNNSPQPFNNKLNCAQSLPASLSTDQQVRSQSSCDRQRDEDKASAKQAGVDMAPKLVHNQYNSPLDLYSMSNIRKTIEAHTELIAPGLKGINFMKADTPVNKQSEVYKLVREEEERERRSAGGRSPTPCPNAPSGLAERAPSARVSSLAGVDVGYTRSSSSLEHGRDSYSSSTSVLQQQQQQNRANQELAASHEPSAPTKPPSCSECGRAIVGPFARLGQRCIHSHCFNCTTCGTSLKNNGYFTINEKLYCEIHAKQVASMMRIQFNFEAKQDQHQSESERAQDRLANQSSASYTSAASRVLESSRSSQLQSANASPATISTMFADRSNSETSDDRREIRYTWKQPASECSSQLYSSSSNFDRSSHDTGLRLEAHHQSLNSLAPRQNEQQASRQSMLSGEMRAQGLVQERARPGDRIPVCVNCNQQIQGPYILAGKTTWCKHCSQSHFNCSSCKRSLLDIGFIEDNSCNYYCECCYEAYYAPVCFKCNIRIKGDCLNALAKQWHPSCFVCGHCRRPFGNSSFYLEDTVPYCERDWKILFTTKCHYCSLPIEAGDKWIEALDKSFHTNCFKCTTCKTNLEGSTFYCKGGKPFCRLHVR